MKEIRSIAKCSRELEPELVTIQANPFMTRGFSFVFADRVVTIYNFFESFKMQESQRPNLILISRSF